LKDFFIDITAESILPLEETNLALQTCYGNRNCFSSWRENYLEHSALSFL